MERITFNEVHQKSLDEINNMVREMDGNQCSLNRINESVIVACLIEMNGYLAAIAESLYEGDETSDHKKIKRKEDHDN